MTKLTTIEARVRKAYLTYKLAELTSQQLILAELERRWARGEPMRITMQPMALSSITLTHTVRCDEPNEELFRLPLLHTMDTVTAQLATIQAELTTYESDDLPAD